MKILYLENKLEDEMVTLSGMYIFKRNNLPDLKVEQFHS